MFRTSLRTDRWVSTQDGRLNAVLEVDAGGLAAAGAPPPAAEVILVDCSGSMSLPPTKMSAARRATAAAVDALREGVRFAIVEGTATARLRYPLDGRLATADAETRAAARQAAAGMVASGGTAMGSWLLLARDLLAAHPGAIRHAILLTDGQNVGETPAELERALAECAGEFTCDARGIGADWEPRELHRITAALRGRADAVRAEAELTDDFTGMIADSMRKVLPDVRIRIETRPGARLHFVRQSFPAMADLTAEAVRLDEHTVEVSTGAWSTDLRHFHLCLTVDPAGAALYQDTPVGSVRLAVVRPGRGVAEPVGEPEPLLVHWTDEEPRSAQHAPEVTHYQRLERLRQLVQDGCDALDGGDRDRAAELLGAAVRLAHELGNAEQLRRIGGLAEIQDAAAGRIELREQVAREDIRWAEGGSVLSVVPGRPEPPAEPLPPRRCACCDLLWPGESTYCEATGKELP